jgi:lysophospholipid acyltransferase (LPLAT)-like uncharacterized protein
VVHGVVQSIAASCRFRVEDPHHGVALARQEPVIFAIWHNRLAFSLIVHRRLFLRGPGGRRLAALVSASRDGAFLASILRAFEVEPVRGSSSRRGGQALVELKSWADQGLHLAITPDGPRGPCYRAQPGIAGLARATGRVILPFAINTRWRWDARTWDRFQVPLPFGRCNVVVGRPVRVSADGDETGLEKARQELEVELAAITRD